MKKSLLIACLAALASTSALGDTALLAQRKPGLWEVQHTMSGTGGEAVAAAREMRESLAKMPPDKRAQMEAYMQSRGMGVSAAADGGVTMTLRFCLPAEDIAQETHGFMKGITESRDCASQVVSRSSTEVHVHAACRNAKEGFAEVDGRIFDIAPDHYAVDMSARTANEGDVHIRQKARWLGGDCNNQAR
jgi:hypothetical protein